VLRTWRRQDPAIETLINVRIAQAGLAVTEVASFEHSRIHGISNLRAARDGWRVLRTILAERYYEHNRRKARKAQARRAARDTAPRHREVRPGPVSRTP
jgi:hypothetical protein